ncbi:hypothetical protein [Luteolibacter sp. Populi]|uniref:hypothetical protein n=1 Tax=Luteolibacter sp. Populi TaxID=3230487 RepID=UPI0034651046
MSGKSRHSDHVFRLSCWGLGVIAFGQLLAGGIAVAVRVEKAREVRVEEKIVTKIVTVEAKPSPLVAAPAAPVVAVLPPPPVPAPLPPARPLATPPIADPNVERLVQEARKARLASDTASALVKLAEAREMAPSDPNVLYETGLLFEEMSAYDPRLVDQAADAYQAVFALGTTGAGVLYTMAAEKLRDGIAMPDQMRDELRLGNLRIFPDREFQDGERTVVTVPVQAAPGAQIGSNDLSVNVDFYDSTVINGKKEIVPCTVAAIPEWVSGAMDFVGGEESLRLNYVLPPQDAQQQQLFGRRTYYGVVAKLYYKGELIDTRSWPRHLSAQGPIGSHADQPREDDFPRFLENEDIIDSADILLPPKMPDLNSPAGVPPLPR